MSKRADEMNPEILAVVTKAFESGVVTAVDVIRGLNEAEFAITREPVWRPIESAPKDETRILVTIADRFPLNTYVACWRNDSWETLPMGNGVAHPTHWTTLPTFSAATLITNQPIADPLPGEKALACAPGGYFFERVATAINNETLDNLHDLLTGHAGFSGFLNEGVAEILAPRLYERSDNSAAEIERLTNQLVRTREALKAAEDAWVAVLERRANELRQAALSDDKWQS